MKKVLLFLVMILLVLVSARSLFCASKNQRYRRCCCKKLFSRSSRKKESLKVCKRKKDRAKKEKVRKREEAKAKKKKIKQKHCIKKRSCKKKNQSQKKRQKEKLKKKKKKDEKKKRARQKKEQKLKKHKERVKKRKERARKESVCAENQSFNSLRQEMAALRKELRGLERIKSEISGFSQEKQEGVQVSVLSQEKRKVDEQAQDEILDLQLDNQEPEVDYAIDTYNPIIEGRRSNLKNKVDRLIAADMDSSSLDGILGLLDSEVALVKAILRNSTGGTINVKRKKRDRKLEVATKPALVVYETIMGFATNDFSLDKQIEQGREKFYLRSGQKREYLKRLCDVLQRYRMELGYKQHQLAHGNSILPTDRYQKYVARNPLTGEPLNTSVDVVGAYTEKSFERFPYFCSLVTRSGEYIHDLSFTNFEARDNLNGTLGSFRDRFATVWGNNLHSMKSDEVVGIIDEVLMLVGNEVVNHSESLRQRNKMFERSGNLVDVNTNIAVSGVAIPSCKKSNVLFGTIKDAAALNTMSSGSWNPDLYEENLRRYAKRLKNFANKIESICLQKGYGDCFGSCYIMRHSLDNLISTIVYSPFSASA